MIEMTVGIAATTTAAIGTGVAGIATETGTEAVIGTARAEAGIALIVTVVKDGDQIPVIVAMDHEDNNYPKNKTPQIMRHFSILNDVTLISVIRKKRSGFLKQFSRTL